MDRPAYKDVKIASNGRMVLPQAVRQAAGIHGETRLVVTIDDGDIRLSSIESITRKVQRLYREHAQGHRTTDDFLAERRREAEIENARFDPKS